MLENEANSPVARDSTSGLASAHILLDLLLSPLNTGAIHQISTDSMSLILLGMESARTLSVQEVHKP